MSIMMNACLSQKIIRLCNGHWKVERVKEYAFLDIIMIRWRAVNKAKKMRDLPNLSESTSPNQEQAPIPIQRVMHRPSLQEMSGLPWSSAPTASALRHPMLVSLAATVSEESSQHAWWFQLSKYCVQVQLHWLWRLLYVPIARFRNPWPVEGLSGVGTRLVGA